MVFWGIIIVGIGGRWHFGMMVGLCECFGGEVDVDNMLEDK
jgi:hypothetical protein